MGRINSDGTKECPRCKKNKSLSNYYKISKHPGWYMPYCRECYVTINKLGRNSLRENTRKKKRYAENPEPLRLLTRLNNLKLKTENPAKYRAKKFFDVKRENVDIQVDRKYIEELFKTVKYCQCCGKLLQLGYLSKDKTWYKGNPDSPSIDRVDNTKGYTQDNIGVICWQCNYRKSDLTEDDLVRMLSYIRRYKNV
jgi:hypothetical protein